MDDVDGDGRSDIARRDDAGHSCLWLMDGGQIRQGIDLTAPCPGAGLTVTDDRSPA